MAFIMPPVAPQLTVVDEFCSTMPHDLAVMQGVHPTIRLESGPISGSRSTISAILSRPRLSAVLPCQTKNLDNLIAQMILS
jgi:hypothetical protein